MTPIEIVLQYMERINQRDPEKVVELMTEDAEFVDSLGKKLSGRANLLKGWGGYFGFCPDYWVSHEEIFGDGKLVAVFGAAGGTITTGGPLPRGEMNANSKYRWHTTAAWLAIVENGLIKKWQVFADNKPVYDILAGMIPK
jgi:ketosteroid isomerase-like protein